MSTEPPPYCTRIWLNPPGHPASGSVVAYDGPAQWVGVKRATFLEVADCHGKVRLHQGDNDTPADMIAKLEALRDVVDHFISHLRSKEAA